MCIFWACILTGPPMFVKQLEQGVRHGDWVTPGVELKVMVAVTPAAITLESLVKPNVMAWCVPVTGKGRVEPLACRSCDEVEVGPS